MSWSPGEEDRFVLTEAGRRQVEALGLDRVDEQRCESCSVSAVSSSVLPLIASFGTSRE